MAKYDNTLFYWLQLKEDFFDDDAIEWLEEQKNGKEYCLFYLKLCLKSLKTNGILIRKVGTILIPYDYMKLAEITKTNPDTVIVAMELLLQIGLIKKLENGELYLTQVEEMVGSQSKGAFKKQQQRITKSNELLEGGQMSPNCPPKLDIEQEKELKLDNNSIPLQNEGVEKNFTGCKKSLYPYKEIVDYLNEKAKTNYKHTTQKTQDLIKARFNQGFTIDDFKKVIDNKCSEWLHNKDYCKYLRPETLFGNKFEGYLNQKSGARETPSWYGEYRQELENKKVEETQQESLEDLADFFKPTN